MGTNAADTMTINADPASKQVVVTLPSNPTTGYQWNVSAYDTKLLKLVSSHYVAPQTTLIGAGGKMIFTFALLKGKSNPNVTPMTFIYARSWEPKSGTIQKVMVKFTKNTP